MLRDLDVLILDALRPVAPPFDPFAVTERFAALMREYRVSIVEGDRYAGAWVSTAFEKARVRYMPSDKTKSQIYLAAEPLFSRRQVQCRDRGHPLGGGAPVDPDVTGVPAA